MFYPQIKNNFPETFYRIIVFNFYPPPQTPVKIIELIEVETMFL